MAVITTNLSCELQEAVKVQYLKGNLFSQDVQANKISVAVYDGGSPASISGTVTANIIREDGGTVTATGGTISGNVVSITLPAAAYIVPGLVSIVIKVTASSVTTTIAAVVVNVYQSSTETAIDPGTIIPSVTALVAQIEAAVASIPADYSSLWTSLAPAFSSSASYTPGQYVTNGGVLYVCTTAHTGSWNASHFSAVNVGGELSRVFGAITNFANDINNEISEELNDIRTVELSANLCDPTKLTVGYLNANGTINPASDAYRTTDFIPVEVGESYSYAVFEDNGTVRVNRYLYLQYDSLRMPISSTYNNSESVPGTTATISDQNVRYIRFCANQSLRKCMAVKSSSVPSTFVSYRKSVTNKMEIPELDAVEVLADETRTDLDGIETKVVSLNLIDPSKIEDGYLFTNSKQVNANYSISGMIPIDGNTYYSYGNADQPYYNTGANKARYISFLDENQEYISDIQNASLFQTPASAVYVVLSFPINSRNVILLKGQYDFTQQNAVYIPFNAEYSIPISKVSGIGVVGKNLFDISKASLNSFLNVYPQIVSNSTYFVTDYIPIESGQKYFVPHLRSYVIYDIAKQKTSGVNAAETNFVFTAPADGYFRCSGWMDEIYQFQIEKGNSASEYEEYKRTFSSGIPLLNDSQVSQAGNILYRKKWAVCGDSFTNGSQEQVNITSGKYRGMKHVYPYIIGNRNEISVLKFFEGGRTLAFPAEPGTFTNSLTNPNVDWYYQNIPADVDYITIYLGINDEHHAPGSSGGDGEDNTGEIPIGTINDSTTATYLGAWNVVLTWLISNRPNAHIGIIVTNGNQNKDEYRQGQIAIAEKYGIPYIDLNGDARTPAMIRTSNPNIPSAIKTALIQKWAVNPSTNTHPNDAAHEFESTFIENFLRSI